MNYLKGEVVLFAYPFTDLTTKKVRPAVVVGATGSKYADIFIVPLTSKTENLGEGEFILSSWQKAGLNVTTAVKRGCFLVDSTLILRNVGQLAEADLRNVETALRSWLDLV
jgi:mRNA interferase MazF